MNRHPHVPVERALSTAQLVLCGFSAIIVVGTAFLSLDVCHRGGSHALVDDLFTATSAVCVTGLMPFDLATRFSLIGQIGVLILIQLGGLGYMTLYTLSMLLVGRRLSLRDRLSLREATGQPTLGGLVGYVRGIVIMDLVAESAGFVLLATQTVPEVGWGRGLYQALFYAVCAPNNAAFSLRPDGVAHWSGNAVFLLTLAALTILGGLGYNVVHELIRRLRRHEADPRWNALISIVLGLSGFLLVSTTCALWGFEHANPRTLGPLGPVQQWLNAFFMAVQPRTSGFNSIDTGSMSPASLFLMIPLMFVGTGPGGTGGGIKLTTVAILTAAVWAIVREQEDVNLPRLKRRVSDISVRKALTLLCLSLAVVATASFAIVAIEPLPPLAVLFEVVSAFGTVGLSMGITPHLSVASKVVLIAVLLIGRIGPVMVVAAFWAPRRRTAFRYAEEPLMVG